MQHLFIRVKVPQREFDDRVRWQVKIRKVWSLSWI